MPSPGDTKGPLSLDDFERAAGPPSRASKLSRTSSDGFATMRPWFVVLVQSALFFALSVVLETTRVLMPVLGRDLGLDPVHVSWTASAVPFGGCAGAVAGGLLSDRAGRRVGMLTFLSGLVAVCALAWFVPLTFSSVLALHACKGVCFGAVIASVLPWGAEHYPTKARGQYMAYTAAGWSLGSVASFAAFQLDALGDHARRIEVLPCVPAAICIGLLLLSDESPRWRCLDSTEWHLREVFATQGIDVALSSLAWVCFSGGWYCLFFWGPELLRRRAGADGVDYAFFMWSSVLTFPCFLVAALVMEYGRKPVFLGFCALGGASVLPLAEGGELTCKVMLVLSDFFTCICWSALAIHGAETFPTVYRASALGWLQFLARISAGVMPLLGGYLMHAAPETVSFGVAAVFAISGIAIWFLPETAGLDLRDAVSRSPGEPETKPLL